MGTNKRYGDAITMRSNQKHMLQLSKTFPLQSLSENELALDRYPLTTYPKPERCLAWVRFGPHPFRVEGKLMRTTPLAAGIEFTLVERENVFRCWVWGNAVEIITLDDVIADRAAHGAQAR